MLVENGEETPMAYFMSDAVAEFVAHMVDHWVSGGAGFEDLYITDHAERAQAP